MARSQHKKAELHSKHAKPAPSVTPQPARRVTPDFARFSHYPEDKDANPLTIAARRASIETRMVEAEPDKRGAYTLWLVQRFNFLDNNGPVNDLGQTKLLGRDMTYNKAIKTMVGAMDRWRADGFTCDVAALTPIR